jgi:hypothetical protein
MSITSSFLVMVLLWSKSYKLKTISAFSFNGAYDIRANAQINSWESMRPSFERSKYENIYKKLQVF